MASIYHEMEQIATSGSRLLFGVSLGRDTACMLHLFATQAKRVNPNFKMSDHAFLHWSPYLEMLPYQARHLQFIRDQYKIDIDVRPDPTGWLMKGITKIAQERDHVIDLFKADFMCVGYRMDESLQRRGMLKRHENGMDPKVREAYPLRTWTSRIIDSYVRTNKIRLAPEYAYGLRDCRDHRGIRSVWLRDVIGETDFKSACAQDPQIEIDYIRFKHVYDKVCQESNGNLNEQDEEAN